jgi:hypothetical protein
MQIPELQLPHWLILAGSVFVVLGSLGVAAVPARVPDETSLRQPAAALKNHEARRFILGLDSQMLWRALHRGWNAFIPNRY